MKFMSRKRGVDPKDDLEITDTPLQSEQTDPRIEALTKRIADLEAQLAASRDSLLRALADLQNLRRRTAQEVLSARETAAGEILKRLLPILDNFERTLAAAQAGASLESVLEGVRLIDRQLRDALEQHDVRPIPALGLPFDPGLHEAVAAEESAHEEGTVIGELEKGYVIGGKVLRPTRVKVSKGKKE